MLKHIFLSIFLLGPLHAAESICIDWGIFSKKTNHKQPLITYASGRFSYILQTTHKTDRIALSIAHGRIHLLCAYHLPHYTHITNAAAFIDIWKPIEEFIKESAPDLQLSLAYYAHNRLLSVVRGYCGLYHWHDDHYTQPTYAEATQTHMRSFKETEYVSVCGVSAFEPQDSVFLFTTYLDDRSCPDTTLPWIQKECSDYSAATQAHMLPLHVYAPRIRLTTEYNRIEAEKRIQENCACIVVKNKKI